MIRWMMFLLVMCLFAMGAKQVVTPPEIRATNEEGRLLQDQMTPADKELMYKVPFLVDPKNNYEKLNPVEMTDIELKWFKNELVKRRKKK